MDLPLSTPLDNEVALGLWLDEMIAGEVARQLRDLGYDVQAVQEHPWARGLDDPEQLAAAAQAGRALVTYNVRDLAPLSLRWAEAQRTHHGVVLVYSRTIPQADLGGLVRALAGLMDAHPGDDALQDRVLFLARPPE